VKVTKVNTQVVAGKPKTVRQAAGRRPDWKKAIVTLAEGQAIEMKA
jgi:large subunit ribosomal protein L23